VFLPTLFVSAVAVPVAVNLISEWLKKRLLERAKDADVKFEMHIEEPDGRTKSLNYEGPVTLLRTVSRDAARVIRSVHNGIMAADLPEKQLQPFSATLLLHLNNAAEATCRTSN
jgi:hypothetical protein